MWLWCKCGLQVSKTLWVLLRGWWKIGLYPMGLSPATRWEWGLAPFASDLCTVSIILWRWSHVACWNLLKSEPFLPFIALCVRVSTASLSFQILLAFSYWYVLRYSFCGNFCFAESFFSLSRVFLDKILVTGRDMYNCSFFLGLKVRLQMWKTKLKSLCCLSLVPWKEEANSN